MSFNQKYNFKINFDQFGKRVNDFFYDKSEEKLITKFEETCLALKKKNKNHYSMIELGSNQAYYSCLFKAILGNSVTQNIMVEPVDYAIIRGKENFKINGFDGVFLNESIGDSWGFDKELFQTRLPTNSFNKPQTTISKILSDFQIDELDILQCDIDGSELFMLNSNKDVFDKKQIKHLFLCTHQTPQHPDNFLHENCKLFLLNFNYELIYELYDTADRQGADGVLIFKSKP